MKKELLLQLPCEYLTSELTYEVTEELFAKLRKGLVALLYRTVEQFLNKTRLFDILKELYGINSNCLLWMNVIVSRKLLQAQSLLIYLTLLNL